MNKYPLIGVSICAVVLLVLGSLTNVVGYQTVQSTAVNDSPLFRTRTQRATNQQLNVLTAQYLGMGKGNILQFPFIDNRTEQLKKAIDIIRKMDDKTFARFTELCIQQAKQDKILSKINPNMIAQILPQLRTKTETISNPLISKDYYNITSSPYATICNWFPGCIPLTLLNNIFELIIFVIVIGFLSITFLFSCSPAPGSCGHSTTSINLRCRGLL